MSKCITCMTEINIGRFCDACNAAFAQIEKCNKAAEAKKPETEATESQETKRVRLVPKRVCHDLSDSLKEHINSYDTRSRSEDIDSLTVIYEQLRNLEDTITVDVEGNPFPDIDDWKRLCDMHRTLMKSQDATDARSMQMLQHFITLQNHDQNIMASLTQLAKNMTQIAEAQDVSTKALERIVMLIQVAKS